MEAESILNTNSLFLFALILEVTGVRVMVLNATINNISVISCRSVLLVEETGENH
jgi:hypothetical protein